MSPVRQLISEHLREPTSSWSVGEFGVLAEFHQAGAQAEALDEWTAAVPGGALRVRPCDEARVLAYETPSPNARLWNHGVAFCLPAEAALMEARTVITELGPDHGAIMADARGETLFDLGLGRRCVNFCVRTGDPAVITLLRSAQGESLLARPDVNAALVAAGPTRVVESRMARIEITNPIPAPGGTSPEGPHTHLMPGLMKRGRVHDANIPVPAGYLPCLTLYPAHPARDAEGRERPFDAALHAAYQRLLERHGDAEYVAAKKAPLEARSRRANLGRLIAARQRALAG